MEEESRGRIGINGKNLERGFEVMETAINTQLLKYLNNKNIIAKLASYNLPQGLRQWLNSCLNDQRLFVCQWWKWREAQ
nr:unnamed protein product [Callosobruchus analis]